MINFTTHIVLLTLLISLQACISRKGEKDSLQEKIQKGKVLFESSNCIQCHSLTGEKMYGPALDSIFQTNIKVIREGKEHSVHIGREYIYRSIEKPELEKHIDFQSSKMPQPTLSREQIDAITEYLIFINEEKRQQN